MLYVLQVVESPDQLVPDLSRGIDREIEFDRIMCTQAGRRLKDPIQLAKCLLQCTQNPRQLEALMCGCHEAAMYCMQLGSREFIAMCSAMTRPDSHPNFPCEAEDGGCNGHEIWPAVAGPCI
jgi:hypothetical protein